jgi:hypothetical protein
MPKIVITHKVADVEKWLKGKADRVAAFAHMGATNVVDHVAADGSSTVAVTAETNDPAAVAASVSAPPADMAEKMQEHGVIPPVTIHVEQ